jgi:monovalent cation/hydrogen antiporter
VLALTAVVHEVQITFVLLLVFIIGFGALAQRLKTPYPIVLVIGGLLLSFIPGLPRVSLNPDFIFLAVLPPLLFASATQTSWRDFKYNLVSILFLAFGLVGFTVLGVSLAANLLIPGFDWRLGLVLGAAVAPTDAIAATAIAKRVGLPQHLVDLLEGESLVNDASGLLALEFSTALIVSGTVPSVGEGVLRLIYLVVGGIVIGVAVAKIVQFIESRVDDAPLEITISLVTPYIAYMSAEALTASGVLATVAAGLYLGRQTSYVMSSRVRIEAHSFWNTFSFLLNGIVFLLIGLQLPYILDGIRSLTVKELLTSAIELSAAVILLRLIWSFPGSYAAFAVRRYLLRRPAEPPGMGSALVVGWTGMRGVVSLAAAIAIPATLASGQPFPQRSVLIFLTFSVILVTLLLQGLTLPGLIRALHLSASSGPDPGEQKARRAMLEAALNCLQELRSEDRPEFHSLYDALSRGYRQRLALVSGGEEQEDQHTGQSEHYRLIVGKVHEVERNTLIEMRKRNEITAQVRRALERELDLLDVRFAQSG